MITAGKDNPAQFDSVYVWKCTPHRPMDRRGQRCRVLVRGSKNSILLEFEDGFLVVTSRHSIRPAELQLQLPIVL